MKKKTQQKTIKEVIQRPHAGRAPRLNSIVVDSSNFKKIRDSSGLSQKELSEKMLVSDRAIIQWEAGERRIHPAFNLLAEYVVAEFISKKKTIKNKKKKSRKPKPDKLVY